MEHNYIHRFKGFMNHITFILTIIFSFVNIFPNTLNLKTLNSNIPSYFVAKLYTNEFNHITLPTLFFTDYASRGAKKFGDKCNNTLECGFPGSICDSKKKACQCTEDLQITNHIDKCGKGISAFFCFFLVFV